VGLKIGPRPRSRRPLLFAITLGVTVGIAVWQRSAWPAQLAILGPGQATQPVEAAAITTPVVPAATTVANELRVPAFTADLYLDEVEEEHEDRTWGQLNARTAILTYVVEEGDTLWSIATEYDLDVDTLRWSNPKLERNPDLLPVGLELTILPVPGVYHTVGYGDTVEGIAARYGVAAADIVNYPLNQLRPPLTLAPDQQLIVPFGQKELSRPPPSPADGFPLAWPLIGTITQPYGPRHRGLDVGAPYGAEVYAAGAGTVVHAAWARTGYGYTIIIDHGQNRQTLYSHLKGALVVQGQQVARGEVIGQVGSTGNSTGPHLHFEARENGDRLDPGTFLPPGNPK
jgi:LysM repeat protein